MSESVLRCAVPAAGQAHHSEPTASPREMASCARYLELHTHTHARSMAFRVCFRSPVNRTRWAAGPHLFEGTLLRYLRFLKAERPGSAPHHHSGRSQRRKGPDQRSTVSKAACQLSVRSCVPGDCVFACLRQRRRQRLAYASFTSSDSTDRGTMGDI